MILSGWLLATALAAEGGINPAHLVLLPPVAAEPQAEPVIVPRRLQAAMEREAGTEVSAGQALADDGELARLLGEEPSVRSAVPAMGAGAASLGAWWWMLPVMGLMAGANVWLRRRGGLGTLAREEPTLKIIARQGLGGTSQLVLIEVEDPSGATRRLLVGTGSEGPRLVSELHPQTEFDQLIAEAPVEGITVDPETVAAAVTKAARASETLARTSPAPRPTVVPESRPRVAPPPPSDPATYASRRYRQINRATAAPMRNEPAPKPTPRSPSSGADMSDRRRDARSLVDEVLASRKETGWTA